MNIPKRISLLGMTIDIVESEEIPDEGMAYADYKNQKIYINKKMVTKEMTEQTYYHELVHWITFLMLREDLNRDEKFVDMFAHLLYQGLSTAVYEEGYRVALFPSDDTCVLNEEYESEEDEVGPSKLVKGEIGKFVGMNFYNK